MAIVRYKEHCLKFNISTPCNILVLTKDSACVLVQPKYLVQHLKASDCQFHLFAEQQKSSLTA